MTSTTDEEEADENTNKLGKCGLKINPDKTKVMTMGGKRKLEMYLDG